MTQIVEADIKHQLETLIDPHLEQNLVAAGSVKNISLDGNKVTLDICLGYPAMGYIETLRTEIGQCLRKIAGIGAIQINISISIIAHSVQQTLKPLPQIKNIVAVASGKGGVGKSTTAVNLALALHSEGAQVGILDADIYGPSVPTMLGLSGYPESPDNKTMNPKIAYGLQSISIGYLIDAEQPMIWRGPMVTGALQQLLNDTNWRDLDYLVVDLPPGTGDIQLTLSQQIPVSGAVIVTTPQDIALLDARRGLKMFEKVNVPVLGIIENMSSHICSNCGHEEAIFGSGGGQTMAQKYAVDLLGTLPLDIHIREQADSGRPTVVADPDSPVAQSYRLIARKMAAKLSRQARDYSSKFPNIVIQNT